MKSLEQAWPQIMDIVTHSGDFLIASVNQDGSPHLTPIATVFLHPDRTGFYLEKLPVRLRKNVERDRRVCIYAVNRSKRLWLDTLIRGRARRAQAVRLIARVGERREATPAERQRWLNKVRGLRWTRGYRYLWKEMGHARDLEVVDYLPVEFGAMTHDLWLDSQDVKDSARP